jgi:hypothetical protein
MAITSKFYDTAITESDWAENRFGDARYGVVGANDWKVTAVAGADRTVSISPGKGFGHGIADVSDTNVTIQLDPIASGSRWDLIAMRRDWQPLAGGPSAFVKVTGSSAKGIPGTRVNDPGVQDDQPVYLVQVTAGDTNPTGFVDLRCWAANGGLVVADKLALDYLNVPGARVLLGGTEYRYIPNSAGDFAWESRETMFREWNAVTTITVPNAAGASRAVSFPAGMFDVAPHVTATRVGAGAAKLIAYPANITTSGCTIGVYSGDGSPYDTTVSVNFRAVQTSPGRAAGVNP